MQWRDVLLGDERVEEGIESLVVPPLRSKDSTESLRFLSTTAEVTADLDEACRLGEVDRGVSNFREEDGVDDRVVLEILQDSHSFDLRSSTVDVELAKLLRISLDMTPVSCDLQAEQETNLECKDVVGEHDNLVATILMISNQELTGLKLLRIHAVQQHSLP